MRIDKQLYTTSKLCKITSSMGSELPKTQITLVVETILARVPQEVQIFEDHGVKLTGIRSPQFDAVCDFMKGWTNLTNCQLFPELEGESFMHLPRYLQRRIEEHTWDTYLVNKNYCADTQSFQFLVDYYGGK